MYYKLVNKIPVSCNREEGANEFDNPERVVAITHGNHTSVSTIFLVISHGERDGVPIVFETMIFGGEEDGYQERYTNWNDAVEGHHRACRIAGLESKKLKK